MSVSGVTRTCTIGMILDALDKSGGSIARVFRKADVSPRLLDDPRRLILLKDQFALLDAVTQEIGDAAVAARLSLEAGIDGIGDYGHCVASQPTLGAALAVAQAMLPHALQTATRIQLERDGRWARWTYVVDDPAMIGRRQNNLLCVGYVLEVFRRFAGRHFIPGRLTVGGSPIEERAKVESMFGCSIESGPITALTFPADLLDCPNLAPLSPKPFRPLATGDATSTMVAYAIASSLGDRRPSLSRIAHRLGLSSRTLQRRLAESGTTFERLLDVTLAEQAMTMMEASRPLTAVAYDLGFTDPAHFSRAFRRWTGTTPTHWRRTRLIAADHAADSGSEISSSDFPSAATPQIASSTAAPSIRAAAKT